MIDARAQLLAIFGEAVRKDEEINGGDAVEDICSLVWALLAEDRNRKRRKPRKAVADFGIKALNAASDLTAAVLRGDSDVQHVAQELADQLKKMKRERSRFKSAINKGREQYATDEIEIDDDPIIAKAPNGTWVNAWVWVGP